MNSVTPELATVLGRLMTPEGIFEPDLEREMGIESCRRFIEVFDRQNILQFSVEPFSAPAMNGTQGYFDATLREPLDLNLLLDVHAIVVGCGAVGGVIACNLAASNVGKMTLVDFDTVDVSNLNRQFQFISDDVGKSKARVLADRLVGLSPKLQTQVIEHQIGSPEDTKYLDSQPADLLICAADNPPFEIDILLSHYAKARGMIYATAGLGITKGYWGPILTPETSADYPRWVAERRPKAGSYSTPAQSFGPTNTIIGGALARDLLHHLMGAPVSSLEARIELEFENWQITRRPIAETSTYESGRTSTCPL